MILQSLPPRIRYRDAPNCVHGIGCRAKKMISIFGTLSGIYWQTCNNSAHLVEGGVGLQSYWKKKNSWKAKETVREKWEGG